MLVAVAACVVGLGAGEPAQAGVVPVTTDLWDISQGSAVTAHSGVLSCRSVKRNVAVCRFEGMAYYRDHKSGGRLGLPSVSCSVG